MSNMQSLGDYEYNPKDLIGHGAFAVVYKGILKMDVTKTVAIKSILKKNIQKSHSLLTKEIKILKELTELHHENVVALLDCKESNDNVYLVMEYCNGGDLADYLSTKGSLSEDTIRLFLVQLAGAMKALYAKGIVHRDLKPQNILLSYNGGNLHPKPCDIRLKVADFGFARFLEDGVMAATLCGSPMYMAPEVIMSKKYDAKADLWSLGTIVYQCLTGKAPFQANTPQALRKLYEENKTLDIGFPSQTSAELQDLIKGLLRREASERMNFETFFKHKFLQRPEPVNEEDLPFAIYDSPPSAATIARPVVRPQTVTKVVKVSTPPRSQPESPRSTRTALDTSNEDDYVIVPKNLVSDQSSESFDKDKPILKLPVKHTPVANATVASPTRPSFLPITEPIPVPTQKENFHRLYSQEKKEESTSSASPTDAVLNTSVPRSQPISMKRRERKTSDIDISSLSPPSVQFVIGTPPGGRRRSTSSSLCETPPPPSLWTVSPTTTVSRNMMPMHSPLRRSGTSPPVLSGPLARVPILSSPNLSDNNNLGKSPVIPFCTRAVTLPEISEMGNYAFFQEAASSANDNHPITFVAHDLPEETLMEKEHNETLAKINFVLALSNCILDLAAQRTTPLGALVDASPQNPPQPEIYRKAEQLILLIRALQLLGSGLSLATKQLKSGQLRPSTTVKHVVSTLNTKFRTTLNECKLLNSSGLLNKLDSTGITADKLLYDHAIQMCQSAALDELFGNPEECFQRYQTAQILLHSLSQQVHHQKDKVLLTKYKDAVEKRLFVLQQQGYIYATDLS